MIAVYYILSISVVDLMKLSCENVTRLKANNQRLKEGSNKRNLQNVLFFPFDLDMEE